MIDFDIYFFGDDFEDEGQILISANIEDVYLNKSDFSEHTPSVTSTRDKEDNHRFVGQLLVDL